MSSSVRARCRSKLRRSTSRCTTVHVPVAVVVMDCTLIVSFVCVCFCANLQRQLRSDGVGRSTEFIPYIEKRTKWTKRFEIILVQHGTAHGGYSSIEWPFEGPAAYWTVFAVSLARFTFFVVELFSRHLFRTSSKFGKTTTNCATNKDRWKTSVHEFVPQPGLVTFENLICRIGLTKRSPLPLLTRLVW